ncbi:MAG: hypothetical protein CMH28_06730 [Micavibrio sp.]|nr:hypothetical protein [Micavibrio sp.]
MSKAVSVIIVVLVLFIGGALLIPNMVDWNKYKSTITEQVQAKTGYTVAIEGDLSLSVFPLPHLNVHDVTVLNGDNTLTKISEVDVSVELLPLLSKDVQIRSVSLLDPVITLSTNAEGVGSWVLAEKEQAIAEGKDTSEEAEDVAADAERDSAPSVSIGSFEISNGTFIYKDGVKGTSTSVENINLEGDMESLKGPFDVGGSLNYADMPVSFDMEVGDITTEGGVPVNLDASLQEKDINISFTGEVGLADKVAKGEFSIEGSDLNEWVASAPEGDFSASGKTVISQSEIALDDFEARLASLAFRGDVEAVNVNDANNRSFKFQLTETSDSNGDDMLTRILSGSDIQANFTMKPTEITVTSYSANLNDSELAGSAVYRYAAGESPATLRLLLKAGSINLDKWMNLADGNERNSDEKTSSENAGDKNSRTTQPSSYGFSIPIAMDLEATIAQLIAQGKTYRNVDAKIAARGDSLVINGFSANAVHNTNVSARGSIANTKTLSGLDLSVDIKTADAEALARSYDINMPESDITIGSLDADATVKGSLENMNFSVRAQGQGLTLTAKGIAKTPLEGLVLENLSLRVQHPNMVQAVKIFSPEFSMGRYWQKPVDLSTSLSMSDKSVRLASISGKAGPVPIKSGAFTIDTGGQKPSVNGEIALGDMVLPGTSENTANQASTSGSGASSRSNSSSANSGKWSSQAISSGWMNAFNADVKVSADSLAQNRWVLASPQLDFSLQNGTLNIPKLKANMFGGEFNLSANAKAGAESRGFSSVNVKANASSLNARKLYEAMTNKSSDLIDGQIQSFTTELSSSGQSMNTLVNNLNGQANLSGQNVVINGIDAAGFARAMGGSFKPVERIGVLLDATLYKGQTNFTSIKGNMPISNGIVTFSPLTLDGPEAVFDITGKVDLPAWIINANTAISIKNSDIPPFDLKISGSLSNPQKTAGSVMENYLQTKLKNKLGEFIEKEGIADKINDKLGIPLLGGSRNQQPANDNTSTDGASGEDESGSAPASEQPKPEDVLKDAIGGFLRNR